MSMKASDIYVELVSKKHLHSEGEENGEALIAIRAPRKWNDDDSTHLKLGVSCSKDKVAMKGFKFVDNHHSFQFKTSLDKIGKYKVSVVYHEEHVKSSPLYFEAYSCKDEIVGKESDSYKKHMKKAYEAIKSLSTDDNSNDNKTYHDNKNDVKVKIEGINHLNNVSTDLEIKPKDSKMPIMPNSDISMIEYWITHFLYRMSKLNFV